MGALASRRLTPLLKAMVAGNRRLDAQLLLDEPCICGVAIRYHRDGGRQVSCVEARDRCFLFAHDIPEADERVKPALRGAQVRGGHGQIPEGGEHIGVEGGMHAEQSARLSGSGVAEFSSEKTRERVGQW